MAAVTCPYCWTRNDERALRMYCGPHCGDEATNFPAAELRRGRCPHDRTQQGRRSCPACGRDLLREYADNSGRTIAVIGSADAGKSTWVGTVIRQFAKGEVAGRFPGMSLDLLGEDSRRRYHDDFEQPLYTHGTPLLQTRPARGTPPEPLIFSLRFPRRRRLSRATVSRPVVTVFYDTAGEDVAQAANIGRLAAYLRSAGGIVVLLDPMTMLPDGPGARDHAPGPRTTPTEQAYVLQRLSELLRDDAGRPITTPLAIALAKIDLVRHLFHEQSPLRLPSRHVGHYDEADGLDVHEEVRAWLDCWYDPGFSRSVANNFAVHRYFGLSALGAAPVSANRLAPTGVHSYRVEDPVLWLLARFGAIPTVRSRR